MFKKLFVTTLSTAILAGGALAGTADAASADQVKTDAQVHVVKGSFSSIEDLNTLVNNYLSPYKIQVDLNSLLAGYGIQQPIQQEEAKTPAQEAPKQEEAKTPAQEAPKQEEAKTPAQEAPKQEETKTPAQKAPEAEEVKAPAAPKQEEQATEEQAQAPAQKQQTAADNKQTEEKQATEGLSAFEQQVVELTNQEREKAGLSPLKADVELSKVARAKSQDMADNGYFDHNSPTYGSPFDMMKSFGISYQTAGENIAQGQKTPEEVVQAWMNSQGHRENILNPDYTNIGVGYVENGNYWTQQFIGK
ncbi:CAP domain-containing protein [Terribacillus halophilus]|uniref:CAP domain-containing protein n=1 Tax=Terribacillus halophilus TaxID=361279 RepID=UPI0009856E98|nr:CAP domain-containing protein [Terribacillus halophilus]